MNVATLFGVGPYVAAGVAGVGMGARVWVEGHRRTPAPEQQQWWLLGTVPIGRWALLLLLLGHGVLLAAPAAVIRWGGGPRGRYVVECSGFLLGLTALGGVAGGLRRHLRVRAGVPAGEVADAVFLSSLTVTLASGLWTAARYRWASLWAAATVAPFARSLALGTPVPSLLATVPFVARLHIVAGLAAAAALPPSGLGGRLARAGWRLMDAAGAVAQPVARVMVARLRARRWLVAMLWPAEDLADLARYHGVARPRGAVSGRRAPAAPARTAGLTSTDPSPLPSLDGGPAVGGDVPPADQRRVSIEGGG